MWRGAAWRTKAIATVADSTFHKAPDSSLLSPTFLLSTHNSAAVTARDAAPRVPPLLPNGATVSSTTSATMTVPCRRAGQRVRSGDHGRAGAARPVLELRQMDHGRRRHGSFYISPLLKIIGPDPGHRCIRADFGVPLPTTSSRIEGPRRRDGVDGTLGTLSRRRLPSVVEVRLNEIDVHPGDRCGVPWTHLSVAGCILLASNVRAQDRSSLSAQRRPGFTNSRRTVGGGVLSEPAGLPGPLVFFSHACSQDTELAVVRAFPETTGCVDAMTSTACLSAELVANNLHKHIRSLQIPDLRAMRDSKGDAVPDLVRSTGPNIHLPSLRASHPSLLSIPRNKKSVDPQSSSLSFS